MVDAWLEEAHTDQPRRRLGLARAPRSVSVRLDDLRAAPLVRTRAVDARHVSALAEVPDRWPPIVVAANTLTVLDGIHRVAAARHLGLTSIAAVLFEGSDDDGFIAAVRANVEHGLPLTLADRRRAALRLLASSSLSPPRSDRAIGQICGLDHKTVARLRGESSRPSGEIPRSDGRIGRDRRRRPTDVVALRTRVAAAVVESPSDSLRQIARRVGASPETVRAVRARIARGDDPVRPGAGRSGDDLILVRPPATTTLAAWTSDSACRSTPEAAQFAAWFDAAGRSTEWRRFVAAVPLSRAYEVAAQARAYADAWRNFAVALEQRTRTEAAVRQ